MTPTSGGARGRRVTERDRRPGDAAARQGHQAPVDRARAIGCLLAGGIVVAPFLALLYDLDAGLAVMALALAATAFLSREAARTGGASVRRRLLVVAAVNGALALVCLVVLAFLIARRL